VTQQATAFVWNSAVDAETNVVVIVATVVVTVVIVVVIGEIVVVTVVIVAVIVDVIVVLQPICAVASSESACQGCLAPFRGKTSRTTCALLVIFASLMCIVMEAALWNFLAKKIWSMPFASWTSELWIEMNSCCFFLFHHLLAPLFVKLLYMNISCFILIV
jgi:hypothetical protein